MYFFWFYFILFHSKLGISCFIYLLLKVCVSILLTYKMITVLLLLRFFSILFCKFVVICIYLQLKVHGSVL